jgi:hypothetical protein
MSTCVRDLDREASNVDLDLEAGELPAFVNFSWALVLAYDRSAAAASFVEQKITGSSPRESLALWDCDFGWFIGLTYGKHDMLTEMVAGLQ